MRIKENNIEDIFKVYGIYHNVKEITFLCENYNKDINLRIRVICKVELSNNDMYIVKFILEKEHPYELIESQSVFSECLRKNGIKTAKMLKYKNSYCYKYNLENLYLNVTIQEYLNDELRFINYDIVKDIAILMAKMHKISELNNCHINNRSIWNLFDSTSDIMRGFLRFKELKKDILNLSPESCKLLNKIFITYDERKSNIKNLLYRLPCYATQGDYSICNLTYTKGSIGIFDYNIAADEVLVIDMIVEGLFISKVMDLDSNLKGSDRKSLFLHFIKNYNINRKLSDDELIVLDDIYAITESFWWSKIIFDEHRSLIQILNNKDKKELQNFLNETYEILSSNISFSELL